MCCMNLIACLILIFIKKKSKKHKRLPKNVDKHSLARPFYYNNIIDYDCRRAYYIVYNYTTNSEAIEYYTETV